MPFFLIFCSPSIVDTPSSFHQKLNKIAVEKKAAHDLWEDGEITTQEFMDKLDVLAEQERDLYNESIFLAGIREAENSAKKTLSPKQLACGLTAVFLFGFFISPFLYPKLFGYKNAQECVLAKGANRVAMAMCFDLYPSRNDN